MSTKAAFTIQDHSGGINRYVQPFLLEPNEQLETVNMVSTELGGLSLREAIGPSVYHAAYDSNFGTTKTMHSVERLTKYDGDQYLVFVMSDGAMRHAKVGGPSASSGIIMGSTFTDSCMFLNQLFIVSPYDATRSYDGTTFSTTTNVTGAPMGRFTEQYRARVYIGNVIVNNVPYPNRIIYSSLPTSNEITWDSSSNYVDIERDDGDKIMGIRKFGERLIIFKERAMYRYDESSVTEVVGAPGTVSGRSINTVDQALIYLAHDGIRIYDGARSSLISRPVQPYIDGLTDHGKYYSFSWVIGNTYYVYVGDIENEDYDIDIKDAVISYDIYTQEFRLHSFRNDEATYPFFDAVSVSNIETTTTSTSTSTSSSTSTSTSSTSTSTTTTSTTTSTTLPVVVYDTREHYIAGYGGLYKMFDGYVEKSSTLSTVNYSGEILYPMLYPAGPENIGVFERANIYLSRPGNLKAQYRIDNGEWVDINMTNIDSRDNVVSLDFGRARGRGIQFRIRTLSGGEPPVIRRIAIFLTPSGQL